MTLRPWIRRITRTTQTDDQQEEVDQTAGGIGCGESQRAQHQQNYTECSKHVRSLPHGGLQASVQKGLLSYIGVRQAPHFRIRKTPGAQSADPALKREGGAYRVLDSSNLLG